MCRPTLTSIVSSGRSRYQRRRRDARAVDDVVDGLARARAERSRRARSSMKSSRPARWASRVGVGRAPVVDADDTAARRRRPCRSRAAVRPRGSSEGSPRPPATRTVFPREPLRAPALARLADLLEVSPDRPPAAPRSPSLPLTRYPTLTRHLAQDLRVSRPRCPPSGTRFARSSPRSRKSARRLGVCRAPPPSALSRALDRRLVDQMPGAVRRSRRTPPG